MNTDQEIKSMCWYDQACVDSINKFVDVSVKNNPPAEHIGNLKELLALCERGTDLLDIGCGSAMVSYFCKDFNYYGCDLPHIIHGCAIRNQPSYFYRSCDIIEDELAWIKRFDVILLNAIIDVMYNGPGILRRVLTHANKYVIVHRQEVTENGKTHSSINPSYSSKTYHSVINRKDFEELVDSMGFDIVHESKLNFGNWENGGSSFLLKNRNRETKKYDSHPLRQLRNRIQNTNPCKVVVGAGDVVRGNDWICTNEEELDVHNEDDWKFLFGDKKAVAIFSEHVWEHLSNPDKAIKNAFDHLTYLGVLRIAVPDGFHLNPEYINSVKPGGTGAGADDHKILWNYLSLTSALKKAGFKVLPKEWWDEHGNFNTNRVEYHLGVVNRSFEKDERNADGKPNYTSLIIDAIKPC